MRDMFPPEWTDVPEGYADAGFPYPYRFGQMREVATWLAEIVERHEPDSAHLRMFHELMAAMEEDRKR